MGDPVESPFALFWYKVLEQSASGVFYEPVKLPNFWSQNWKATVVYCTEAVNPGRPHQARAAEYLSASWHEIETGHYPMLSTPDRLVELILEG